MMRYGPILLLTAALSIAAPAVATAAEQAAVSKEAAANADYDLVMVTMTNTAWQAIRYQVKTGKSWLVNNGGWIEIKESGAVPASEYRVYMVALAQDWGAVRMDARSGRSWRADAGKWVEMPEPKP